MYIYINMYHYANPGGFQVHRGVGVGPTRVRQARKESRRRGRRRQVRGKKGPKDGVYFSCMMVVA